MLFDEPVSRRGMRKAEKIGIWLGAVTLVVTSAIALGAWLWPREPDSAPQEPNRAEPAWAAPGTSAPTTISPPPSSGESVPPGNGNTTYLAGLGPQSGGANLATLPRALNGKPGYEHPIVVQCPTNQSNDKVRSVTYPLRGRYLDFAATVRPYYTADREARTYVRAVAGVKERDGTLTRQIRGTQFGATMAGPAPVAAVVEGAEELTIEVECQHPQGFVVLADARVTAAP